MKHGILQLGWRRIVRERCFQLFMLLNRTSSPACPLCSQQGRVQVSQHGWGWGKFHGYSAVLSTAIAIPLGWKEVGFVFFELMRPWPCCDCTNLRLLGKGVGFKRRTSSRSHLGPACLKVPVSRMSSLSAFPCHAECLRCVVLQVADPVFHKCVLESALLWLRITELAHSLYYVRFRCGSVGFYTCQQR